MTYAKITLRAARVNAGLTQTEAADSIGVSVATIQNWESGASIPAWDKVIEIEKAYKWPADSIIFFYANQMPSPQLCSNAKERRKEMMRCLKAKAE